MFLLQKHHTAKGNLVKIPKRRQLWEIARQRNETATQRNGNRKESSFLFNVLNTTRRNSFTERRRHVHGKVASFILNAIRFSHYAP